MNTLISLFVFILVIGVVFWILEQFPIAQPWKNIARGLLALIAILMLLSYFGLVPAWGWHHVEVR